MEILIALVVIALPLALIGGSIFGFLAWLRLRKLSKRLDEVQPPIGMDDSSPLMRRIAQIEHRIRQLEQTDRAEVPMPAPATASPTTRDVVEIPDTDQELSAPPVPAPEPVTPVEPPEPTETGQPAFPEAPSGTAPPEKPKRPPIKIEWERWIGVRGAAAAGGVVLALAALLFFQYSIENNLISPTMRVVFGMMAGIGCLLGSEFLVKRQQRPAANALAGAGVVALYAATWAAHMLYSLIGAVPATALMVLVTAVCVLLAVVRSSQFIAVLGLLGGFSTPVLVAAEPAGPAALFGYILLLDLGLLWLARARGWPLLAVLSLVGTAVHQGIWIFAGMDAERTALGLTVLAVFGLAFLFANGRKDESTMLWKATRAGGVAIPFAFAMHFASAAKLSVSPVSLGLLLTVLSIGACWMSRQQFKGAAVAAAAASLGVLSLWALNNRFSMVTAWQIAGVCGALIIVFTINFWLSRDLKTTSGHWTAATVASLGLMTLTALCAAAAKIHQPWPWLAVWVISGAGLFLLATKAGRTWVQLLVGMLPPIGFSISVLAHARHADALSPEMYAALFVGWALILQAVSVLVRQKPYQRWSGYTAAIASLLLMPSMWFLMVQDRGDGLFGLIVITVLVILGVLAATRLRSGPWYLVMVVGGALWHAAGIEVSFGRAAPGSGLGGPLALLAATVVFLTVWPTLSGGAFRKSRSAWWGAALAGPVYFIALREAFIAHFGPEAIGVLPVALAVLTLVTVMRARPMLADESETLISAQVWLLAVTLCLVSVAIPLQVDKEWVTIGWALNGLAVLALWVRLDHPGLKYFGLALIAAATLRLVVNPEVLGYHLRGSTPILNWISYTYLVPAVAMILSMRCLAPREVHRLLPWEIRLYPREKAVAAGFCGLAAIATVFVWINLAVADFFAAGQTLELTFERLPARDLTTSVAWAAYALVLLVIGVRTKSKAVRWLSLGLLVATLGKVFLHDLGELKDLYRVASLVGLAGSLIVVSLIYQRFVFAAGSEDE